MTPIPQDAINDLVQAQASIGTTKGRDEHIQRIEEKELAPATARLISAAILAYGAMVTGSIAAIGMAVYLTRSMSLLPRALIGFGSGGVGFWAGFLATKAQVSSANDEFTNISSKVGELRNQATKGMDVCETDSDTHRDQRVGGLETNNASSTTHTAKDQPGHAVRIVKRRGNDEPQIR
jgi:hypothetical protein